MLSKSLFSFPNINPIAGCPSTISCPHKYDIGGNLTLTVGQGARSLGSNTREINATIERVIQPHWPWWFTSTKPKSPFST